MKSKLYLFSLILGISAFAACSSSDEKPIDEDQQVISATAAPATPEYSTTVGTSSNTDEVDLGASSSGRGL